MWRCRGGLLRLSGNGSIARSGDRLSHPAGREEAWPKPEPTRHANPETLVQERAETVKALKADAIKVTTSKLSTPELSKIYTLEPKT